MKKQRENSNHGISYKRFAFFLCLLLITGASGMSADTYNPQDTEWVKTFLKANYANFGYVSDPTVDDITTWITAKGCIVWNEETEKRIIKLSFLSLNLSGDIVFSGLPALESLLISDNPLKSLTVSDMPALKILNCSGYGNTPGIMNSLTLSNLPALEMLSCSNKKISSLDVSMLSNLKELYCNNNQINSIDVSMLSLLEKLNCEKNNIEDFNCTGLKYLDQIFYSKNPLKSLTLVDLPAYTVTSMEYASMELESITLSGLNSLNVLNCPGNNLTHLSLSNLPELFGLNCSNNQLENLYLSDIPGLMELSCGSNPLTSLSVSEFPLMTRLTCDNIGLETLDISNLKDLIVLNCRNNNLETLTFSEQAKSLKYLTCSGNRLEDLDVSAFEDLEMIDCKDNQLKSILFSTHNKLYMVNCSNNRLTSLDIPDLPKLSTLNCSVNQIPFSGLPSTSVCTNFSYYGQTYMESDLFPAGITGVDLSRFAYPGNQYEFYDDSSSPVDGMKVEDVNGDGKPILILPNDFRGELNIVMKNPAYPEQESTYSFCYNLVIADMPLSLTINSPGEGSEVKTNKQDIVFTVGGMELGLHGKVKYSLNGIDGGYTTASPVNITGLTAGANAITLELVDMAGNSLASPVKATLNITYTTPPTPPVETSHSVTIPQMTGITTNPNPGTHMIKDGEAFDLTITLSEEYYNSDVRLYVNGQLLTEESREGALYRYRIPNVKTNVILKIEGVEKDVPTGVSNPSEAPAYQVYTRSSLLYIEASKPGDLGIYGIGGKAYLLRSIPEGNIQIELSPGVYIVRIEKNSWKIVISQ